MASKRYNLAMTIQEKLRFWDSIDVSDGCWIWMRSRGRGGYGQTSIGGKSRRAHRVAYELYYGVTLTPDQLLHHKCHNKSCVNPHHLEITNQWNHVDSAVFGNEDKTHCPHGHEYTLQNICWNRNGRARECRTCKYGRIRRREQRLRKERQHQRRLFNERLGELIQRCEREGRWKCATG